MTKLSYSDKLKDIRWQKKRLQLLEAANWKCTNLKCSTPELQLHVHHRLYRKNADPWDYEDWCYAVLCENCHAVEQYLLDEAKEVLAMFPHLTAGLSCIRGHGKEHELEKARIVNVAIWEALEKYNNERVKNTKPK